MTGKMRILKATVTGVSIHTVGTIRGRIPIITGIMTPGTTPIITHGITPVGITTHGACTTVLITTIGAIDPPITARQEVIPTAMSA